MTAHFGRFVAYYRVSTDKQGRSGLGLDAQEAAVEQRLNGGPWQLVREFTEVESGRRAKRPQLEAALKACKKLKAKLVVAKLDRLSRNTRFLLALIEAGVDVLFCDLPEVTGAMGKFILTQMAAVAELEAGLIAERTKEALAAAKKAGKKLGGWNVGSEKARREAQEFADKMRQVMAELAAHSAHQAAAELNKRGIKSATGGQWYPQTILRLRERLA